MCHIIISPYPSIGTDGLEFGNVSFGNPNELNLLLHTTLCFAQLCVQRSSHHVMDHGNVFPLIFGQLLMQPMQLPYKMMVGRRFMFVLCVIKTLCGEHPTSQINPKTHPCVHITQHQICYFQSHKRCDIHCAE